MFKCNELSLDTFSFLIILLYLIFYFFSHQKNGHEMAIIVNNADVEFVSQLLQIDATAMTDVLTQKLHVSLLFTIIFVEKQSLID